MAHRRGNTCPPILAGHAIVAPGSRRLPEQRVARVALVPEISTVDSANVLTSRSPASLASLWGAGRNDGCADRVHDDRDARNPEPLRI